MDADGAAQRAGIYRLFSSLFAFPPQAEMVALLQDRAFTRALAELPGSETVWQRLETTPAAALVEELALQWTALFSAPGPQSCPPYESVYRDNLVVELPAQPEVGFAGGREVRQGTLWGDSTARVLLAYAEEGVGFRSGYRDIPDHLALELAFAAYLAEQEADALAAGDAARAAERSARRRQFLAEHPAAWLAAFAQRLARAEDGWFYAAAARLVVAVVAADRDEGG